MALTIGPAVRQGDRGRVLAIHTAGLLTGAVAWCLVLVLAGSALGAAAWPELMDELAAVIVAAWTFRVLTSRGVPFPRSRWQVPDVWRHRFPEQFTAFAYGLLLGVGFLTDVVLPAYWILVAATVLSGSLAPALAAWTLYALTRAVTAAREASRLASQGATPELVAPRQSFAAVRYSVASFQVIVVVALMT